MNTRLLTTIATVAALRLAATAAPDGKGAYASPEDAAADPDFALQGEYAGS